MIGSTVLCATDFSAASELALTHSLIFARATDSRLLLVHILRAETYADADEAQAEAESRLERILRSIKDVPCEYRLLKGDPAKEVLGIADREKVELIAMGTHGRTGLMRLLMGSVAEQVVRHANCPVMTVKLPPDDHS